MDVEEQVCDVELSKKLKEYGLTQDTIFAWAKDEDEESYSLVSRGDFDDEMEDDEYPAYTVAELEKLLPIDFNVKFQNGNKRSRDHRRRIGRYGPVRGGSYYAGYGGGNVRTNFEFRDDKMANAMARLLIEIVERTMAHKGLSKQLDEAIKKPTV